MRQEPTRTGKGRTVKMTVHANLNGKQLQEDFDLPASLKDAVKIYGEDQVFKMFINSLIIVLQARIRSGSRRKSVGSYTWADAIKDKAEGKR